MTSATIEPEVMPPTENSSEPTQSTAMVATFITAPDSGFESAESMPARVCTFASMSEAPANRAGLVIFGPKARITRIPDSVERVTPTTDQLGLREPVKRGSNPHYTEQHDCQHRHHKRKNNGDSRVDRKSHRDAAEHYKRAPHKKAEEEKVKPVLHLIDVACQAGYKRAVAQLAPGGIVERPDVPKRCLRSSDEKPTAATAENTER